MDAPSLLAKEFLEMRCRLIDLAASLDRMDRAPGGELLRSDPRLSQLLRAARLLADDMPDRAERLQMLFSDPFNPSWRNGTGI
ncbi:MAG: hypothetical protein Q7R41_19205 [Phycisphaerales bacterium]|nr:hypothetical protein [Phycisphaerales bacterium]